MANLADAELLLPLTKFLTADERAASNSTACQTTGTLATSIFDDTIVFYKMGIKEINLGNCLTTNEYNPSPHRFDAKEKPVSERTIPMVYTCEKCENTISFKPENFERHNKSEKTNLTLNDKNAFGEYIRKQKLENFSFLDFYCPNCKLATTFIFDGGPSGYWGYFEFKIERVLVLEP